MKSAKQILIAAVTLIIFLLLTIWRYSGKTSLLPPSLQPSFGAFQGPNSTLTERLLLPGTPEETPLYIIASPVEGPTVLVIGGIHGNEPAGYMAAEKIVSWEIDRGRLLVIPRANVRAIDAKVRFLPGTKDLNRVFPGRAQGGSSERIAAAIFQVMEEFKPDWVVDLHESRQFERVKAGGLGQSILYPRGLDSLDLIQQLINIINHSIMEEEHHFILRHTKTITGGTISAAVSLGLEGFFVETTTQLPLEDRIQQQLAAVHGLLSLLEINVY
ncbi:MAG TPA: succinylglutamate desuccinylase/aspartoacylase family protein [Bacillota bacterium]|nr:hypothetical protein [Bacillota bacterium]HOB86519.1 succinylglutamate desuccinylase/aspartoacylase family protein [Bacillota bacterium]HOP68896.1 succinylglutamate desuccinylase/aspartoacylase family protein [Bacillota bacterium]HPT33403.1 succinylglutamate desuccinylase/aspartoacylase family protein [Bacillota bacterium]HQD05353.1 succinylglutamate desuccinylase/aspartoacylase family protein [Bacillota bacterium]